MNAALPDLVSHAAASISAAEVFSAPFPHIFFRDFFPGDFYRELIDNLPGDAAFEQLNNERTRFLARIYDGHVDAVDPDPDGRWRKVSAVLQSPEVERAIRARLVEGLEIRRRAERRESPDDLGLYAKPVIYKDLDGYRIKPHPDTRKKVVTMQLYLPRDEARADMGTTLYRLSPRGLLRVGSSFLEPVKTFPFLPNVGYAFVVLKPNHSVLKTSWHGRPAISTGPRQPRVSILNTFYAEERFGV